MIRLSARRVKLLASSRTALQRLQPAIPKGHSRTQGKSLRFTGPISTGALVRA